MTTTLLEVPQTERSYVRPKATRWNEAYLLGRTPWDRGKPNPELVRLVRSQVWTPKSVLDIGCGKGWDIGWLSELGFTTCGVDVSDVALQMARRIAPRAMLVCGDIASLLPFRSTFGYAIDIGYYQGRDLDIADRSEYACALFHTLAVGGEYLLSCVMEASTGGDDRPRSTTRKELLEVFSPYFECADLHLVYDTHGNYYRWISRWRKTTNCQPCRVPKGNHA